MDQSLRYKALRAANIASFVGKKSWGGADEERRLLKEYYCKNKSVSLGVVSQTSKEVTGVLGARVGVVGSEGNVDHENKEDHKEKEDHEDNEDNEKQQNGSKNNSARIEIEPVHEPVALVFRSKV
jgi:hypothetical protein